MKCGSVLVVDDDKDILDTLKEALELEGYAVLTAINGLDALNLLSGLSGENLPGCIILDLSMPVMNGPEFLNEIEINHKELSQIPVVIASANLSHYNQDSLKHASQKIRKPLDIDVLYNVVNKYCGSS